MSLLDFDGFDWAASAGHLDGEYTRAGTISIQAGRGSGNCVRIGNPTNGCYLERLLDTTYTTLVRRFAVRFTHANSSFTEHPLLTLVSSGGAQVINIAKSSGGVLIARRGAPVSGTLIATGNQTINTAGGWTHIKLRIFIDASTGFIEAWVNGTLDTAISLTGLNTGSTAAGRWRLHDCPVNHAINVPADFDDSLTDDDDPSNLKGDRSVIVASVGQDEAQMDWSPSTGTDVYAVLDDVPANDDTDYATADTNAQRSEFGLNALGLSSATIEAAMGVAVARQESAGAHGIIVGLGANGTITDSAKKSLMTTYTGRFGDVLEENPDTTAGWQASDFDSFNAQMAIEYDD
jgi:hypothetical protein